MGQEMLAVTKELKETEIPRELATLEQEAEQWATKATKIKCEYSSTVQNADSSHARPPFLRFCF